MIQQSPTFLALPKRTSCSDRIAFALKVGFFMEEIWKPIPNYEGIYEASSFGNVKSLNRIVRGYKSDFAKRKGKILKITYDKRGYGRVILYKDGISKSFCVHQLVAICFLNHIPNKYEMVINHIDINPRNNRLENLEIVTQRTNANLKQFAHSSKYTGVSWHDKTKKWRAVIWINGKQTYLGLYVSEFEAHLVYETALKHIINK